MADFIERLQSAVGDAYRLERELGGGGMSRVFVAEETRLRRQVVIKVLPPEMAAGVSVERFEREIQVAAKLQHPHIVALLTAGSHDDLLYYVMPLIEGESLRAKLAREGALPVGEAVRILRDICDALAYAHKHGVVHRDIKPDNVLLSNDHALVVDFGVAKAVSESTGELSLTSMGVALGTPTYMSPEQAAANPHVDHRSDIYSLGALAYEMLCGRPPFEGGTPQAMLAAHVTQAPEPVTAHRATVPPAMNDLVMRCLAKLPADRYQTADELKHQFDAMTTPSGGVTPTGTQPVAAVSAETAVQQNHPVRVAGLFGLASIGALAIVYVLMTVIGLPDWVFLGAIAGISLLVGGIGIMNIMLVSVTERTREIGIRKAMGAKRRDILFQFVFEATLLSLGGGGAGVVLGLLLSWLLNGRSLLGQPTQTVFSVDIAILALVVSGAIGLFFGIYPAMRAARLHPIEALRYE